MTAYHSDLSKSRGSSRTDTGIGFLYLIFRSTSEKELTIISINQNIEEKSLKSKNCRMIVQAMCDHFSLNILNMCPDLKNFLMLEQDQDLEVSF
jgi:hypothetical protein